jgi:hypothetical protein
MNTPALSLLVWQLTPHVHYGADAAGRQSPGRPGEYFTFAAGFAVLSERVLAVGCGVPVAAGFLEAHIVLMALRTARALVDSWQADVRLEPSTFVILVLVYFS